MRDKKDPEVQLEMELPFICSGREVSVGQGRHVKFGSRFWSHSDYVRQVGEHNRAVFTGRNPGGT